MTIQLNVGASSAPKPHTITALRARLAAADSVYERAHAPKLPHFGRLFGESGAARNLFHLIAKVAPTRASVLITGESGVGKDLVATTIHEMSRQSDESFIALNCGAIPTDLIEAELFGHERGSFTGAVRLHKGCFERAAGGTLFLDEIAEMPLDMQVKLLRVLETGVFCRVGGDEEVAVSVRVIAATNRSPGQAVDSGLLRADLLYRLAVFPIEVPALRERADDIELLAQVFLGQLNDDERTQKQFSSSSLQFLRDYRWPGNVRELKNAIHRAFILADHQLDLEAAVGQSKLSAPPIATNCVVVRLGSRLYDAERSLIFATLEHCGGNKTRAAEVLGVSLKTLYNRLNEYRAGSVERPEVLRKVATA